MNMARLGRCLALEIFAVALLAGCASTIPAPVTEIAPTPAAAPTPAVATAPTPAAATAPRPGYYTVKKGDTLYGIALDHGLSYRDIAAWNSLDNPNKIQVGQQLRVEAPQSAALVAVPTAVSTPAPVEARPLEAAPVNTETLKRGPKGGKQPYSPEALAKLQKSASPPAPGVPPAQQPEMKPVGKPVEAPAAAPPVAAVDDEGMAWVWPLQGKLIDRFAEGVNKGIDIAAKIGEPVLAAAAGKVVYVGSSLRGYGQLVIVKHNATFLSAYAHNSKILVKEGQNVTKGQEIAEAGSTDADRPMLHFEIRRLGKPVDPLKHLPSRSP